MRNLKKCLASLLLLLMLCDFTGCVKRIETAVYQDVPEDSMVVKRETMRNILETVIEKDQQLKECLERERIK